jgi:hypothetical protein
MGKKSRRSTRRRHKKSENCNNITKDDILLIFITISLFLTAITVDVIYYSLYGTFGWWWNSDWTVFNFAGVIWIYGFITMSMIIARTFNFFGEKSPTFTWD